MYLAMLCEVCELERAPKVTEIVSANVWQLSKTRKLPRCPVRSLERDSVDVFGQLLLWLEESEPGRGGDFVAGLQITFQMQSLVLLVCPSQFGEEDHKRCYSVSPTGFLLVLLYHQDVGYCQGCSLPMPLKQILWTLCTGCFVIAPYLSHECWKTCLLPDVQGVEECA